ncbi:hypothetical protein GCM10010505_61640 [Kitasatospora aburaviensis]
MQGPAKDMARPLSGRDGAIFLNGTSGLGGCYPPVRPNRLKPNIVYMSSMRHMCNARQTGILRFAPRPPAPFPGRTDGGVCRVAGSLRAGAGDRGVRRPSPRRARTRTDPTEPH